MSRRKFLVATREAGRDRLAIYFDAPPTKSMLNGIAIVYQLELLGRWRDASLAETTREYTRRRDAGTLPPDNTRPRPRPKPPTAPAQSLIPPRRRSPVG